MACKIVTCLVRRARRPSQPNLGLFAKTLMLRGFESDAFLAKDRYENRHGAGGNLTPQVEAKTVREDP
jgi:hypothetical protein